MLPIQCFGFGLRPALEDAARSSFQPPAQDIVSWRVELESVLEQELRFQEMGSEKMIGNWQDPPSPPEASAKSCYCSHQLNVVRCEGAVLADVMGAFLGAGNGLRKYTRQESRG